MKVPPPAIGWLIVLLAFGNVLGWAVAARAISDADKRAEAAEIVIARADSIHRDWVGRGCAPRTQALP